MFAASVAAEALLFPVGALVFSRVTFAGLALNFLAIPLMAVAQIAGMAVVPLALVSARRRGARRMDRAPRRGRPGAVRGSGPVCAGADLSGGAAVVDRRRRSTTARRRSARSAWREARSRRGRGSSGDRAPRRWSPSAPALWILVDPRTLVAARGDGRLHVTFLDVGQGDSAFVVFPRGSTLLVDAGGLSASSSFDIGDRVVAPVVRDAGFRRIDYRRADARRSRSHRRRRRRSCASSGRGKCGRAFRCRASSR